MKKLSSLAYVTLLFLAVGLPAKAAHHSSSSTFKYSEINAIGNPADVVEVKEAQSKALAEGEVRVKMLAAPIHPSNLLQISGNYLTDPKLPSTPGSEGVGRVLEIADGVKGLSKGQLVLLAGMGTWREEIVAAEARFIPLPDLGSPSQAVIEQLAMSTINPLTALLMLNSYAELNAGDWIVQSASNSAVGGYLIQLAKQRGIKTINIVRRDGLAEDLKAKGADVVLIDGPDLTQQIIDAANNEPVRLAVDAVGGKTFTRMLESLGEGGTIVSYGLLSGQNPILNPGLTIGKDLRTRGFWLTKWFQTATATDRQAAFGQIIPLIASGALKADIDSRFSIADVKQAVSRAGQGGRDGKVLLVTE